jgi:membrane-associated phospholipid phosphatase
MWAAVYGRAAVLGSNRRAGEILSPAPPEKRQRAGVPDPSVGNVSFKDTVSPPRPSRRGLAWFFLGAILSLALAFALDQTVIDAVGGATSPMLRRSAQTLNRVLDWPLVILGTGAAAMIAAKLGRARARNLLFAAFLGAAASGVTATSLRSVTGRTRPGASVAQGWYGPWSDGQWHVGRYAYAAFPSGHTATLAGVAGVCVAARTGWAYPAAGLTALIAWARIYSGAHRLSDVTAATLLGLALGGWVWRSRSPTRPPKAPESKI